MEYRPVSLKELIEAISRASGSCEDPESAAKLLLDYFGFENFVLDNFLEKEDRRIFYRLEEAGLVKSFSEETYLPVNGAQWRSHFWVLDPEILRARGERRREEKGEYEEVLEELGIE